MLDDIKNMKKKHKKVRKGYQVLDNERVVEEGGSEGEEEDHQQGRCSGVSSGVSSGDRDRDSVLAGSYQQAQLYDGSDEMEEKIEMDVDGVLNEINLGFFHYRLLFICGLSYMADAVEIGFLSYASLCIKEEWNLSTFEASSLTACLFFGSLVGNLFVWQRIADTYGRRPACILGNFIVLFFGLATIAAPNLIVLLVILFITGIGVGSVFVPFDLLAEYLPAKKRGNFLTNINYFWTAGSLFVSFGAWCVISLGGWRALAVVVAFPVLLSLTLTICFLPESPRWLVLEGKPLVAENVIQHVASVNSSILPPFYFADIKDNSTDTSAAGTNVWSEIMNSPVYRAITLKLMVLSFAWGLSYYGVVLLISRMYSGNDGSETQEDNHAEDSEGLTFNYVDIFLNALCELVGILLTSHIIDRLGRQKSQALLYSMGALSHILTSLFFQHETARNVFAAMSRISIIGACSVTVVMTPELYPTAMRVGGHALANSASRIGSIVAPYVAQNMSMSVTTIGFIFAIVDVSAALLAFTLPETAGRTLEVPTKMSDAEEIQEIIDFDNSATCIQDKL
jgi:putative MFS transporter